MGGRFAVLVLVVTGTVAFIDVDRGVQQELIAAPAGPVALAVVENRSAPVASRSIVRAMPVSVVLDSGAKQISTAADSVATVLSELGVVVDADTVVSPAVDSPVTSGMTITARTPDVDVDTVIERVTFDSEEVEDPTLAKGKEVVQTAGRVGETSVTYVVHSVDGVEVTRNLVATKKISEVRAEVVRVGTLDLPDASAKVLSASEAKVLAKSMVTDRGWDESQFTCLDKLWTRESNWQVKAANPSSSAYGIPQSLPGSKMGSVGSDWRTNAKTQIAWGLNYIQGRYGSPCGAWGASQAKGWY